MQLDFRPCLQQKPTESHSRFFRHHSWCKWWNCCACIRQRRDERRRRSHTFVDCLMSIYYHYDSLSVRQNLTKCKVKAVWNIEFILQTQKYERMRKSFRTGLLILCVSHRFCVGRFSYRFQNDDSSVDDSYEREERARQFDTDLIIKLNSDELGSANCHELNYQVDLNKVISRTKRHVTHDDEKLLTFFIYYFQRLFLLFQQF